MINIKEELDKANNIIGSLRNKLSLATSKSIELYKRLKLSEADKDFFKKLLQEAPLGFPTLLEAIKKYDELTDEALVQYLKNKKHPALNSAERVKEETKKRRKAEYECRQAKLLLEYYFNEFPDIQTLAQEKIDDIEIPSNNKEEDISKRYLSNDEYKKLSITKRNQLALDRFWQRKKSKRQIGKLYEQYIGYLYEQLGYKVEYFGILKGLEDLGRDLICKSDKGTLLIQCKYWAQYKTIYEKYIFQFYGTSYMYAKRHPFENVHAAFITSTHLSDIARSFAKSLNIKIYENIPLRRFPMIKCNIGRNEERIYHLPFDQQYDVTKINTEKGDCYCDTVAEAEAKGFRRAYRWRGNNP